MYDTLLNPVSSSNESELLLTKKLFLIGNNFQELSNQMIQFGYASIIINNSEDAIELLKNSLYINEKPADGIICDYELLKSDNFFLLDEIKKSAVLKRIPVLSGTSDPRKINKIEALQKGIDDFFIYNSNPENIYKRLSFYNAYKKETLKPEMPGESQFNFKISQRKRAFDIIISSSVLLILSPLFLIIALLIKLESKGPLFYISKRAGTGYQIFNFYKFRSMRVDADKELQSMMNFNQYVQNSENGKSTFVKFNNDPRITRVGSILRKTSLDEIPQLINVIKGDMSIVGNRPLPLYEAEQLTTDTWGKRFLAPAGITGLWQVTKRGKKEMSEEERKNLDVAYANNRGIWYDLKLIAKTFPALFQDESV